MRDALAAVIVLTEAGFDTEIDWDAIDDYSDAAFMKVARYADDTDTAVKKPSGLRFRLWSIPSTATSTMSDLP